LGVVGLSDVVVGAVVGIDPVGSGAAAPGGTAAPSALGPATPGALFPAGNAGCTVLPASEPSDEQAQQTSARETKPYQEGRTEKLVERIAGIISRFCPRGLVGSVDLSAVIDKRDAKNHPKLNR
jgi:hypothetical protein